MWRLKLWVYPRVCVQSFNPQVAHSWSRSSIEEMETASSLQLFVHLSDWSYIGSSPKGGSRPSHWPLSSWQAQVIWGLRWRTCSIIRWLDLLEKERRRRIMSRNARSFWPSGNTNSQTGRRHFRGWIEMWIITTYWFQSFTLADFLFREKEFCKPWIKF